MNTLQEIAAGVFGDYKLSFYITYFIFVLIGVIISLRIGAMSRDKNSPHTPFTFSWKFLFQDNLLRMVSSMAVVFVAIRLGQDLLGITPTYAGAVILGISFDQILIQLQKLEFKARE